jgi:hypothetical protein
MFISSSRPASSVPSPPGYRDLTIVDDQRAMYQQNCSIMSVTGNDCCRNNIKGFLSTYLTTHCILTRTRLSPTFSRCLLSSGSEIPRLVNIKQYQNAYSCRSALDFVSPKYSLVPVGGIVGIATYRLESEMDIVIIFAVHLVIEKREAESTFGASCDRRMKMLCIPVLATQS